MKALKNKLAVIISFLTFFYTLQSFGWVSVFTYQEGKQVPAQDGFVDSYIAGMPPSPIHIDAYTCKTASNITMSDLNCYSRFTVPSDADYNNLNVKVDSNSNAISVLDKKVTFFQLEMVNGISKEVERVLTTDKNTRGMTTPTGEKLRDLIRSIVQEEIQKALDDRK